MLDKDLLVPGDRVVKVSGYPFPGILRGVFMLSTGRRYIVEFTDQHGMPTGLAHIFNREQLARDDAAPPAERSMEAQALEYIFGTSDSYDWWKVVEEKLVPPWPLEEHLEAMGLKHR